MAGRQDIRAGRAFVELFVKDSRFFQQLNAAGQRMQTLGAGLQRAAGPLLGLGTAITGAFAGAARQFANTGDELQKLSIRTGASTEFLSEMGFAAEQSGASLDSLGSALLRMNRRLGRLTAGSSQLGELAGLTKGGQQRAAMEALGLSAERLSAMNPEETFMALADAMASYGDQAEAAGLAQRAFGREVDTLLPLILEGRDGIEALRKEAQELGLSVSREQADAAAAMTDAWNRVTRTVKALAFTIGSALDPELNDLLDGVKGLAVGISNWVRENRDAFASAARLTLVVTGVAGAVFGLGTAISIAGFALSGIASVAGIASTAIALIISPVGLVIAGIGGAAAAAFRFRDSLGQVGSMVEGIAGPLSRFARNLGVDFRNALSAFNSAWAGIVDAIKAGDLELATQIAMAGLNLVWQTGMQSLKDMWLDVKFFALETWLDFKTSVAQIFTAIVTQTKKDWTNLVSFIESAWVQLANSISNLQEGIGETIVQRISNVGEFYAETFPEELVGETIGKGIKKASGDMKEFSKVFSEELEKNLGGSTGERAAKMAGRILEIEERRKGRIGEIEEGGRGAADAIEADRKRALTALESANEGERVAAAEELLRAERELANLRSKAAAGREEVEARRAAKAGEGLGAAAERQVSVSFSGAALSAMGMGAGTDPQRDVARETREMRRVLVEGKREEAKMAANIERLVDRMTQVIPFRYG